MTDIKSQTLRNNRTPNLSQMILNSHKHTMKLQTQTFPT